MRGSGSGPASMRRRFVTPEGVDLQLELGTAGARAGAFVLDALMIVTILLVMTVALAFLALASKAELTLILWLLGFFVLRNGWFSLFEMGGRGATPGKRMMGLRVVARDGARLTGGAVIARNAMREIEVFLPLSFLFQQTAEGTADALLVIFALVWSGIFLFFPLFNRDRLRIGDLVAGTWVVRAVGASLGADLVRGVEGPRRTFTEAALNLYGVEPHAFDGEATDLARAFASYAAVAVHNMHLYESTRELAEHLDIAMRTRAVIEQAQGILMSQRRCDATDAFNLLAAASQRSNRKLRDIAQAIVDGVAGQDSRQN